MSCCEHTCVVCDHTTFNNCGHSPCEKCGGETISTWDEQADYDRHGREIVPESDDDSEAGDDDH